MIRREAKFTVDRLAKRLTAVVDQWRRGQQGREAMTHFKDDIDAAHRRVEAWWSGELIDRAVIQVTAPRSGARPYDGPDTDDLHRFFTDPELVLARLRHQLQSTFYGGEAFPVVFPVATRLVAILEKYLGAPNRYLTRDTAWSDPIIDDWAERPRFRLDPANEWFRLSRRLLEGAVEWARSEGLACYVGQPDLNGPTEVLAGLRGAQRLALDMYDNPAEIAPALEEINRAWLDAWRQLSAICHRLGGWFFWMGIWSGLPAVDLQSDVSCLLSRDQFDEHFLPFIEQQTRWAERTVYHLDGPGAIRHLDSLLALSRLTAIQWVPGAGALPATRWTDLCRRIQAGGKRLYLSCLPGEVETLLGALRPEGLMLATACADEDEARGLLARVAHWSRRRR